MTREEKIICKDFLNDADKTHSCNEYKLLMALLEQEPTDNDVVLTYDAYHDLIADRAEKLAQEFIIDKIIELVEPLRHLSIDQMSDIEWQILRVIDKYKAESEGKE